jgi:hypothetical protein
MKTCRTCRQRVPEKPVLEDQSRNGVRVHVRRFKNGSTVVDADCQCFGLAFRLHSSSGCPLLRHHLRETAKEIR